MKIVGIAPLWALLGLSSLSNFTEAALATALPGIAQDFTISAQQAQKCSSFYFLGFATGILVFGRASDIYGRRPIVLAGMGLFLFTTILCIFAPNIKLLITLRFIQGLGASVGSVVGQAMTRDSYTGKKLAAVYASLAVALAFVPSVGSIIGGYLLQYFNWQSIYKLLGIVTFILLVLYGKFLPETNKHMASANKNSFIKILKISLKDRILLLYAFIVGAFSGIAFGFYMEAPFIFINKVGISPSHYGILALFLCFSNACGSLLCRSLVKSGFKTNKIMFLGLLCSLLGCTILLFANLLNFSTANKYLSIGSVFIPMMLHMLGHSLLIPFCLRYAIQHYSRVSGTAGSIFGSLYYLLITIISLIISKIHGDNIIKFTILFFLLSLTCNIFFIYIKKLVKNKVVPDFY